jgi:pyruvate dehydrogenase E2 component (dihydrolipoamide acetyltransferase)
MADRREALVPDIGDFTDVPVIEILVAVGDDVVLDQPLVTLESDKATMDVPSPFAGKIAELNVEVGDQVSEGSQLAVIELEEGAGSVDTASVPAAAAEAAEGQESRDEEGGGAEPPDPAEDGGGTSDRGEATADAERRVGSPEGNEVDARGGGAGGTTRAGDGADGSGPVYASPAVRRLARELGVDLSGVKGTGRKGRITKEDVKSAKERPAAAETGGGGGGIPGLELAPWPKLDFAKYGDVERVPLSRIKRISGPNVARNWVMIPHVTHNDEADITDLESFRKQVNSEQDVKVTMVALLVKACVASLRQFPDFNSSLDGDELVIKRYYNIGFAADTPHGLMVPVIKECDRKGLLEIAGELRDLSGKAREGKISAEEMRGSTFTISSLGGIGGTSFTPIVNAPDVAILGVTRSQIRPVWDAEAEEFRPRLMLPLSLSYDHRVIDGAAAARFVAHLAAELADLRRVLL